RSCSSGTRRWPPSTRPARPADVPPGWRMRAGACRPRRDAPSANGPREIEGEDVTATGWIGRLDHIHITPAKSQPMQPLEEARLVAGRGIEGDRYLLGTGTYSISPGADRELTLIESEMLARVAADYGH